MKQREVWAGTGGEGNNFLGHHEYLILGSGVEGVETADSGAWFRIKHHPIIFPFRFLLIFLFIKVLRFHQEDRAPESFQPPVDLPKSEMMSSKKLQGSLTEKTLSSEEQQAKINETRKLIGPIADKLPVLCSNASILRFLRAQNWNTKKAGKMLKQTLKWRLEYKPEKIRWEDISHEAETGKVYMANYFDKFGRIVLIMRPGYQNTNSTSGQIRYLVYCMEHAIKNLNLDQEHMVWLIDFQGWNTSSISMKVTRETAHILQHHYPERLGLAILYNPPKVFESFWTMVKPFIEPKTFKKVKFVYPKHPESQKIMEELFDMDKLESGFGGRSSAGFVYQDYAQRMMEDDGKISDLIDSGGLSPSLSSAMSECQQSDSLVTDHCSEASDESSGDEAASSNLEVVDEKIQAHPSPSSNDVANGEALKQQPSNEN